MLGDETWRRLCDLPGLVVAASATIEHEGQIGSTREIVAGLRAIVDGAELYLENPLIQGFFADYKIDGRGEARTLALSQAPDPGLTRHAVDESAAVTAALARTTNEAAALEFCTWVYGLADEVINSVSSGGFLGIGGHRVTTAEQQYLDDLAAALGLARS